MRTLTANLVVAVSYVALGWFGLHAMPLHPVISGVWPAAGLAVAVLFVNGSRLWPGILVGAFVVNALEGVPLPASALMAAGNTLGPALGAWFMVRSHMSPAFARLHDVGGLTAAASAGPVISAVVGVSALWLFGRVPSTDVLQLMGVWWSGDALGILVLAPVLLIAHAGLLRPPRRLVPEAIVLMATLAALTLALFASPLPYMYAVFPVTALIAFRLGSAGAVAATVIVAGVATASTAEQAGPFAMFSVVHNLFLLQLFLALLALKGLVLAAATAERRSDADAMTAAQTALAENRDRLAVLSQRLFQAQESERRIIARGLHDDVGQTLTAVKMGLEGLREAVGNDSARAVLHDQVQNIDAVLRTVRDLSFELHPAILDDLGLAAALRQHVDRLAQWAGLSAHVDVSLGDVRLAAPIEAACFRLVQEALNNIVRHARATMVAVTVIEDGDGVAVMVRDDGVGFDPRAQSRGRPGIGLLGLHERAALVGGDVDVDSAPGMGTTIIARFPAGLDREA